MSAMRKMMCLALMMALLLVSAGSAQAATTKAKKVELDQNGTVILNVGMTMRLGAKVTPVEATGSLKWSTSKKKYATVSDTGLVTAKTEGTTTITVRTGNGKKDTVKIKVVDPYKPSKVKLSQNGTVTVNRGSTLRLNAILEPSTAQSTLTWKSSKTKYATVSGSGLVTAKAEGTTTITVKTHNGKKATVKVKVVDPYKPLKITLGQKGTITLNRGATLHLSTALEPTTAQSTLTWKSSKTKYATVDGNGNVTGKAEGTTTITVKTHNGKKATVKVKVVDPYKPTGVKLDRSGTVNLEVGKALQLNATLSPSTARSELKWKSSNTKVAKVDANGLITAIGKGTATISATSHNGKKASVSVKCYYKDVQRVELKDYIPTLDTDVYTSVHALNRFERVVNVYGKVISGLKKVEYEYPGLAFDCYCENSQVKFLSYQTGGGFILENNAPYSVFGLYPGMSISDAKASISKRKDLGKTQSWYCQNDDIAFEGLEVGTALRLPDTLENVSVILIYNKTKKTVDKVYVDVFQGS